MFFAFDFGGVFFTVSAAGRHLFSTSSQRNERRRTNFSGHDFKLEQASVSSFLVVSQFFSRVFIFFVQTSMDFQRGFVWQPVNEDSCRLVHIVDV